LAATADPSAVAEFSLIIGGVVAAATAQVQQQILLAIIPAQQVSQGHSALCPYTHGIIPILFVCAQALMQIEHTVMRLSGAHGSDAGLKTAIQYSSPLNDVLPNSFPSFPL
jgi:hypothetical protein